MKIKRAYLFYEQSGTFRDAFIRHGIKAECYDIANNDGKTDHVIDLFIELHEAFNDMPSIIDGITPDDITMAFFPCIHFEQFACMFYSHVSQSTKKWSERKKTNYGADKFDQCAVFYRRLWELISVFKERGLRLIVENPIGGGTLLQYLMPKPSYIDKNRTKMGDCYVKPTAYWFFNCIPENGQVIQINKNIKTIEKTPNNSIKGVCSLERSRIEPAYAYNFIAAKILGNDTTQNIFNLQTTLEL